MPKRAAPEAASAKKATANPGLKLKLCIPVCQVCVELKTMSGHVTIAKPAKGVCKRRIKPRARTKALSSTKLRMQNRPQEAERAEEAWHGMA